MVVWFLTTNVASIIIYDGNVIGFCRNLGYPVPGVGVWVSFGAQY